MTTTFEQAMTAPTTLTVTRQQMERLVMAAILHVEQNREKWTPKAVEEWSAMVASMRQQVPDCFPGQDYAD